MTVKWKRGKALNSRSNELATNAEHESSPKGGSWLGTDKHNLSHQWNPIELPASFFLTQFWPRWVQVGWTRRNSEERKIKYGNLGSEARFNEKIWPRKHETKTRSGRLGSGDSDERFVDAGLLRNQSEVYVLCVFETSPHLWRQIFRIFRENRSFRRDFLKNPGNEQMVTYQVRPSEEGDPTSHKTINQKTY